MINIDIVSLEHKICECQIGMYYTDKIELKNGFIMYSKEICDEGWNFWTGFHASTVEEFLSAYDDAVKCFKKIGRKACFVISSLTKISNTVLNYISENYNNVENSVVLWGQNFTTKFDIDKNYSFRKIDNESESELFVKVFATSKTQTLPDDTYGPLPSYYFDALRNSFKNKHDWAFNHYISLYKGEPIGMVSACVKDNFCGLYGAGTFVEHRKRGVFAHLLQHIVKELKCLGVENFFCLTEKDSYNERYYQSLGFKSLDTKKYYI